MLPAVYDKVTLSNDVRVVPYCKKEPATEFLLAICKAGYSSRKFVEGLEQFYVGKCGAYRLLSKQAR